MSGGEGMMSSLRAPSPLPRGSPSPTPSSSNGVPSVPPSNSQIEAVIQMATSNASAADARTSGRDTRTQLFVGNLPYRVRWQDLKDLFRKAGTVLRADVSLGPDNRSRGYGTVLLATAEDAARAVEMFNGYNWQTRTLEVRPDRLPPDFDNSNPMVVTSNSNAGPSAGHTFPLAMHPMSYGSSLGEGASGSGADEFAVNMFGERPRTSSGAGARSLFVGNLPFHCQWQDLKDLFRQAGTIVRADVALGPDGRSRGFGTVSYANDADAEHALNMFNGYEYNGRTLKVHYDKYSQGQPSQSPIPLPSLPPTSPHLQHAHAGAPTHIPMPMPPPMAAFEHFASGHPSPSPFDHPFGQISPYDIFPPHIAAIAGNAAAQAYMNNPPQSPPAVPQPANPSAAPTSTLSTFISSMEATPSSSSPESNATANPASPNSSDTTPPAPSPSTHNHPHPGPISLPSPPMHPFPHGPGPMSPLQGLPPITPSMPTFTFVPQNATPPLSAHFLSPGIGLTPFSPPGTMSPGAFYHPPPNQRHPLGHMWNVAPGAPLHMHSPVGSPGSPGFYAVHSQGPPLGSESGAPQAGSGVGLGMGPGDYFSVPTPPRPSEGYFPPVSALRSSGLSKEIKQEGESPGEPDADRRSSDNSAPTTSEGSTLSDLGLGIGRAWSSAATSVEGGDEVKDTAQNMSSLSLGEQEATWPEHAASPPHPPAPQRTHSDGPEVSTPSVSGLPPAPGTRIVGKPTSGETLERPKEGDPSATFERRASWTPEVSRTEFRRGLPAYGP